jgi:glycosyltransferase involved in cell wall biosynthesis
MAGRQMEDRLRVTPEKISRRLRGIRHTLFSRLFPLRRSVSANPQVSYARQAPGRRELATGGRVKLIALDSAFPETQNANLLYLVSSALPSNYRYWVERAISQKIPIVLNQNGVATPGWAGNETDAVNAPLRWVLERAVYVLYQSEFCRKSADLFIGRAKGATRIAYNAVDLNLFSPAREKSNRPLTILLGGSQYQKYRVTSALEALASVRKAIPDARLLISGKVDWQNDPKRSSTEAMEIAKKLGVSESVRFTGTFLQADAPALYREADLLLHPKYNDPCPTAVIEALACGLGVVHSQSGGLPELVDESCGVGVPVPESYETDHMPPAEAWADALVKAAARLPEMRAAARKRAEVRFGIDRWLDLHGEVFRTVISAVSAKRAKTEA